MPWHPKPESPGRRPARRHARRASGPLRRVPRPGVPDVLELPRRFEAPRDPGESIALVEVARDGVARERAEPETARRLSLGPIEHPGSDALAMKAYADIELCDRFA